MNVEIDETFKVPFRHLSMLAQIRINDSDVWAALEKTGYILSANNPSEKLCEKLSKIRTWINSNHFPSELRININTSVSPKIISDFGKEWKYYNQTNINYCNTISII